MIHPKSIYGVTKQVQEQIIQLGCNAMSISSNALRYQNVYGPGQSLKNPYAGILSIFSQRILEGQDIDIFEDGQESRDFVYIDDVADATILTLEKEMSSSEVYNIGTGSTTTVQKVVNLLQTTFVKKVDNRISGNYRVGDIRTNYADITCARRDLGFSPKIEISEGLKRFSEWVVAQQYTQDKSASYEKSLDEMKERGLFIERR